MKMTALKRADTASLTTEMTTLHTELRMSARTKLGYRYGYVRTYQTVLGEILAAGVQKPFTRQTVDKYKRSKEGIFGRWRWDNKSIQSFNKEIPDFALQTALEFQEKFPGAAFGISELVHNERPTVNRDPFLFADLGGHRFYLEVWDEEGFDAKRVV